MKQLTKSLAVVPVLVLILFASGFSQQLNVNVREHVLGNGMKFLVVENHDAPVFSAIVRAKVGSVDEQGGQTGLSHFLEHMMFKGTKIFGTSDYEAEKPILAQIDSLGELYLAEWKKLQNQFEQPPDSTRYKEIRQEIAQLQDQEKKYIVKDELWETYLKNGGSRLNASTGDDGTQYYVSLPANKLELWMLLESDRFENTVFREFYSEREVVYEERRMRTDNNPWGKIYEQFGATAFTANGYHHPVVGWASDIESWDPPMLSNYFHSFYTPNNVIAVIAGDVDADKVFELADQYFGTWERGPVPPRQTTYEPPQKGQRHVDVDFDANPILLIGYHIPAAGDSDLPALDVLSDILSSGRTSRLYKSIVEDKKLASSVSASSSFSRYSTLFTFSGEPLEGHTPQELRDAIYAEVEKVQKEPVTNWELQKVKNQFDASMIKSVNSNMGLCWRLSIYEALAGNWEYINTYWQNYKKVTADDVMRVANKYLNIPNSTIATLVKSKSEESVAEKPLSEAVN